MSRGPGRLSSGREVRGTDYLAAPTATQSFYIEPAGSIFAVITPSVPIATVGVGYQAFLLQASGAPKPYKWTLVGGALPTGIHLKGSGVLLGRPSRHDAAVSTASRWKLLPTTGIYTRRLRR